MSATIIRFDDVEAYEINNEEVTQILDESGFPGGEYPTTRTLPPILIIPTGLGDDVLGKLNGIDGVHAEVQTQ
ncbi:hypothetical protein PENDEC_c006G02371 [Penicillium decumbens]|uniref:Glutaredoxin domain-containing protein n=1 Tax=Penicillium decumbens TaxID=69771 RepID=A0A1V6PFG9_PENDC|nr:hypothetical protein PENDEC_c006G02371 [Penicillium decumbens]